jgi:cellulose synthase operon protein B
MRAHPIPDFASFSMSFTLKSILSASTAVSIVLFGSMGANSAQPAPAPARSAAEPAALKHLPAGPDELVFHGEAARRSFPVYIARGDVDRVRTFRLALKNTVALLPERSSLKLSINGQVVATVAPRSPNGISSTDIAIPAGLLVPGVNRVEMAAMMTHRVDCSIPATYELWTQVDSNGTGFVLPSAEVASVRALADLVGLPPAVDGTMPITLRLSGREDAAAIARAGRFIDALVRRAGLSRPVVQASTGSGRGAGFDVLLAADMHGDTLRNLQVLGREDGLTLARDSRTDRLVVIVSALDGTDLDGTIAELAAAPAPAAGSAALLDGETRRSFADLGFATEDFAGRHYVSALDVSLPGDFYPANYDKARLLIDGSYASDLDPNSQLVFRVNGTLVSTLQLGADRGGQLAHEQIELPLRFFHPGRNEIGIEGVSTTAADRQCNTTVAPNGPRLTIAGSSEMEFPRFARLGTLPQIPAEIAQGQGTGKPVELYLPDASPVAIGSGLTVLANLAASRGSADPVAVHLGAPGPADAPGIVVAPLANLPSDLSDDVHLRMHAEDQHSVVPAQAGLMQKGRVLLASAQGLLKRQGFFFGGGGATEVVPFSSRSLLVTALEPRAPNASVAGVDLPRFTSDPAQWLVFTAADSDTLTSGLTRLVSDGHWQDLQGQAVSLDLDRDSLTIAQPSRVAYVIPRSVHLSDIRPILGGIISSHIELSLALLMLLMSLLGVSTHALIRRAGPK